MFKELVSQVNQEPVTSPISRGYTRRNFLRMVPFIATSAAFLTACNNYQEQTATTKVSDKQSAQDYGVTIETTPGKVNIELFTSKEYYFNEKQAEVTNTINDFVNSGSHNISEIQTSYSDGYLTAGRANYSPDSQGKGNSIRVRFIQSSQYYWGEKNGEVKKELEDLLKNTQNVYKVNTVFQQGYLLAAEIWYYQQ